MSNLIDVIIDFSHIMWYNQLNNTVRRADTDYPRRQGLNMKISNTSLKSRFYAFWQSDGPFYILFIFAIIERLLYLSQFGIENLLMISSDSGNYLKAGIEFAQSGRLTYMGDISALIMPGITVLIGLVYRIFGEGQAFMWALQILWMSLGVCTMIFLYKAANLLMPKPFALCVAAVYLLPTHVSIDSYLLTEGPFFLFFAMAVYYMLKMGRDSEIKNAVGFGVSLLCGLMFRANILILAFLCLVYVFLTRKYTIRDILKRAVIICLILAVFIIPWSIRNYHYYDAFVPVTYGANNPILDGTYQADVCPVEDKMDWSVTDARYYEQYGHYYDENGKLLKPDAYQYLQHMLSGIVAEYRIERWLEHEPLHFLKTYLIDKPLMIINWPWHWVDFMGINYNTACTFRKINFLLCGIAFVLSFIRKKQRLNVSFLLAAYTLNLYLVSSAYAIDRYAQAIMPYRYLAAGIGFYLLWDTLYLMIKPKNNA